ncbi:MAG: hypothetical protein NVV82_26590 [Sporocytophaga sp.]|jgi:hypothetical protein|nr:hypothetical protein [Sporocytophaga sp.]
MKELAMLSNLKNVTVNLDAKSKGKSAQVIFCENWDNVKVALGADVCTIAVNLTLK